MKYFLVGFMGAGKSHWGRRLASELNLPFIDLDDEISLSEGRTIAEIFIQEGEPYFRRVEREVLNRTISEHPHFVMATGGGTPCHFDNMRLLKQEGTVIWLNPPVQNVVDRLKYETEKRPLIRDLNSEQLVSYINHKIQDRKPYYEQADIICSKDLTSINELLNLFHEQN